MSYIFQPRLRAISIFVLTYLVLGALFSYIFHRFEFTYYAAVTAGIIGIVLYMDKRVKFSPLVLWGLAIWGLVHFAGGLVEVPPDLAAGKTDAVLYDFKLLWWIPKYDLLVHAYGFGIATIAAYEAMRAHLGPDLRLTLPVITILVLIGNGLGAINELVEFSAVLTLPETNVGGYMNTGFDLLWNMLGTLGAIAFIRRRWTIRKAPSEAD